MISWTIMWVIICALAFAIGMHFGLKNGKDLALDVVDLNTAMFIDSISDKYGTDVANEILKNVAKKMGELLK